MQQRVEIGCTRTAIRGGRPSPWRALALAVGLSISIGCPVRGRADDPPAERDNALPTVLLVIEKTRAATPQQDDLNSKLRTTLKDAFTHSGRFQVHPFYPNESVIKRALIEHMIAADDLVEPYKPEGLQRIAKAIGSKSILKVRAALDRTEVRTDM